MRAFWFVSIFFVLSHPIQANELEDLCGKPPTVQSESTEEINVIKGNVVSRLIAGANVERTVREWKTDVYADYPNANKAVVNARLQYQVCAAIHQSRDLSASEKTDLLIRVYRHIITGEREGSSSKGTIGNVAQNSQIFQNNLAITFAKAENDFVGLQREVLRKISSVVSQAVEATSEGNVSIERTQEIVDAVSEVVREIPTNKYILSAQTFEITKDYAFFLNELSTILALESVGESSASIRFNNRRSTLYVGQILSSKQNEKECKLVLHETNPEEDLASFSFICTQP